MSRRRRFVAAVLAGLSGALCSACVAHPVGPARTYAKFEGKAVTTAEGALSAVETARLAARTADKQNGFGPYLSAVASESEEAATSVLGTFDSIQPPNRHADALRDELDALVTDAVDHLSALRIAFRRGHLASTEFAGPLRRDAARLSHFIDEHQR